MSRRNALRRAGFKVLGFEALEPRRLLATTVFIDFGSGFEPDGLVMSAADLENIGGAPGTGPNLGLATDELRFQPLEYDYNGDGSTDTADILALQSDVMVLANRMLEPFDIDVVGVAASSLDDVRHLLAANNTGPQSAYGKNDAYIFATEIFLNDELRGPANSFGLAATIDWGTRSNDTDEVSVAFMHNIFAATQGTPGTAAFNENLALRAAHTAVHEALHSFGLRHSTNDPDDALSEVLLADSDIMQVEKLENRDVIHLATRFKLALFNVVTDDIFPQNAYEHLVQDADIGFRDADRNLVPDVAYVTGTGANDRITIKRLDPDTIRVWIEPFTDTDMTKPVLRQYDGGGYPETITYDIVMCVDTDGVIIIEAGLGNDRIFVDADIPIRGGAGDDRVDVVGDDIVDDRREHPSALIFYGESGNDRLVTPATLARSITAYGGPGNDYLEGGAGDDLLYGDAGDDVIVGRAGNDRINLGIGADQGYGGSGSDLIIDGVDADDDILVGNEGADILLGTDNLDILAGGGQLGDLLFPDWS